MITLIKPWYQYIRLIVIIRGCNKLILQDHNYHNAIWKANKLLFQQHSWQLLCWVKKRYFLKTTSVEGRWLENKTPNDWHTSNIKTQSMNAWTRLDHKPNTFSSARYHPYPQWMIKSPIIAHRKNTNLFHFYSFKINLN